jgi:hypothetical protein
MNVYVYKYTHYFPASHWLARLNFLIELPCFVCICVYVFI